MFESAPIELITALHTITKELKEVEHELANQNHLLIDLVEAVKNLKC